jgi:hypothetical protein
MIGDFRSIGLAFIYSNCCMVGSNLKCSMYIVEIHAMLHKNRHRPRIGQPVQMMVEPMAPDMKSLGTGLQPATGKINF